MGNINLSWDNTAVNASANVTGQQASKRIKAVGGAYDLLGFTPANTMLKSVNAAVSAVTDNRVYEYKIEALCSLGGPIPNINGIQEGINFACIAPSLSSDNSSVNVSLNLINTDITKVRFTLRKQSDSTIVGGPTVVNRAGNSAATTFTGLAASTGYYVTMELYAVVNGVEVVSSSSSYLNAVCGGNTGGSQVTTTADPTCPAPTALVVGLS